MTKTNRDKGADLASVIEQYRLVHSISNNDLLEAIETLTPVVEILKYLDDRFLLTSRELERILENLNKFKEARGL